jgi:hypothetical protein
MTAWYAHLSHSGKSILDRTAVLVIFDLDTN